ncbi:gallidermin family lantibiotic [Catenulispora sp. GP43]
MTGRPASWSACRPGCSRTGSSRSRGRASPRG